MIWFKKTYYLTITMLLFLLANSGIVNAQKQINAPGNNPISEQLIFPQQAADKVPRLLSTYKQYNIVRYQTTVYGVPQALGSLDLRNTEDRNRTGIHTGKTTAEVAGLIDASPGYIVPQLVISYKDYNIVKYGTYYYGIPQSLGHVDLNRKEHRALKDLIVENDIEKIKKQVDMKAGTWQTLKWRARSIALKIMDLFN